MTLKGHMKRIHDKTKDHACQSCGKLFASKDEMKKHVENVHEKMHKYTCPFCKKAFSESGTLKRHITLVHEKRNHLNVIYVRQDLDNQ